MGKDQGASGTVKDAARTAERSPAFRRTARVGFAVLGVLHILIGATAMAVAAGGRTGAADQGGAMGQLHDNAIGALLLIVVAVALAALAVWRLADAFLASAPKETTKWGRRFKALGVAAAYSVLAVIAVVNAVGGHTDSSRSSQTLSTRILAAPAGGLLLVAVGVAVIAVGGGFVFTAITRSFTKELRLPPGPQRTGIEVFGVVGYLAKGIAVAVTGVLFIVASATREPHRAAGLDAALHAIDRLPFGAALLYAVAAGLIVYGIYCIARAWYERM
ncbi:DUF1206 domain-containing protein [Microbacterium sp. 22242]|uniref:DUF1206 domain-containing protein n=1 Tax=Microbacterium sp. 22242 TaxID=3453896 RepID=UPI003F8705BF